MSVDLPDHLGGHLNKTHMDRGSLVYMINEFNVKSFLDVGCGTGGMVQLAIDRQLIAMGVDGDFTLDRGRIPVHIHDYTKGPVGENDVFREFDLGWCVEFLEHVEEQYISNFMPSLQRCKYVICTHATPDQPGHHHVNCQEAQYWKDVFDEYGFKFSQDMTDTIRGVSTMAKPFVARTGMVFINKSYIETLT
jgi:hypothetical protein